MLMDRTGGERPATYESQHYNYDPRPVYDIPSNLEFEPIPGLLALSRGIRWNGRVNPTPQTFEKEFSG
jgi:hypothetical protein